MDGEVWHLVEGRRDDGAPAIFRIRELAPRLELPRIFVVEMPYPITEMSRLPNAAAYRRLAVFEEQWLIPACAVTGYELVGLKIEEGSFFLYMYGAADPNEVISRLAPFDAALGFYDDADPSWGEYATLKDLLDQAKAMPLDAAPEPAPEPPQQRTRASTITGIAPGPRPAAPAKAVATTTRLKKPVTKQSAAKKPAAKPAKAKSAGATKSSARRTTRKPGATKTAAKRATSKPGATKTAAKRASKRRH
jgi:hypothetical protein